MSGNVRNVAIESGMVLDVGLAFGILLISHAMPEMQYTSGLLSSVLTFGGPAILDNVRNIVIESGMLENVGIAVRISLIYHPVPKMQCTSGLPSPVLTSGSPAISDGQNTILKILFLF